MPKPRLRLEDAIRRIDRIEAALELARRKYLHADPELLNAYLEPFLEDLQALKAELEEDARRMDQPNNPTGRVAMEGE